MYTIMMTVLYACMGAGQNTAYVPDYGAAKKAANSIFHTLRQAAESNLKTYENKVEKDEQEPPSYFHHEAGITLENIDFQYKSRNVKVLKSLSLDVPKHKTVALVGQSGCGKSTIFQLLQKFYEIDSGRILVNGQNIDDETPAEHRRLFGVVQQEPSLFNRSIADNIRYGVLDRIMKTSDFKSSNEKEIFSSAVPIEEVISTAKKANCDEFISALPQGYETIISKSELSGGQKQRIAIARALIRNPDILLLDEATSALDAENEQIIMRTLDEAKKNKTCMIIAHRLVTIMNADRIYVIDSGRVVEQGTYQELISKGGHFFNLVSSQL